MAISTILFFDLDGTLIVNPFGKVVFPTVTALLARHAPGTSAKDFMLEIIAESQRRQTVTRADRASWIWDWDDMVQVVAQQHGITAIPRAICEELAIQHAAPPYTATLDEAEQVLRALRRPERRLVVTTMGLSKYQIPVLRGLGIYDLFNDVLTPDLAGFLKTEAGYYRRYTDLGSDVVKISIGDNYIHDVEFPNSLGHRTVLRLPVPEVASLTPFERSGHLAALADRIQFYPASPKALPDAVVVHLRELPEVIAELEQER